MLRKILAMILCGLLVLGLLVPAVSAAEEEPFLDVTLQVYSDRTGHIEVEGVYRDNVLYIHPHTVCELTGALIREDLGDSIVFSLHGGQRLISVGYEEDTGSDEGRWVLRESLTMGRGHSYGADIPAMWNGGVIYISATHLLRYMGAVVGFGADENSETHMTVHMPYTMMDLIKDFVDERGLRFSWSEAEGVLLQPEDVLGLAALDTILLGYDANLLAYALPGHGDKVGVNYYTDVLKEILRTEGAELTSNGYNEVNLFGDASDVTSFSANWIKEVLGWIEEPELMSNVNKAMSGALDKAGLLLSVGGDYLKTLDTAAQFANMGTNQQQLLDMTLNTLPADNEFCKELPLLFKASEEVSQMISGAYNANAAAGWNSIYSLIVNAGTSVLNNFNPFSLAWDTMTAVAKINPLTAELLNDEKSIVFAAECQNVQIIAWDLMEQDNNALWASTYYMNGNQDHSVTLQEYLKMDIILSLKSALTARSLLIQTGWLTEPSENTMQITAVRTAKLLQKAQNAKPVRFDGIDKRDEDITWIKNLVGCGDFGNVVSAGGKVFYWGYDELSFYNYGAAGFSKVKASNKLMCIDRNGNFMKVAELEGSGKFAIVNNHIVFYQSGDGKISSYDLNTKETKKWGEGYLQGVSDNGAYVYYENYSGQLMKISVREGVAGVVGSDMNFVAFHDGRLYATDGTQWEDSQAGEVVLYSMEPDGTKMVHLCTTDKLYDYYGTMSSAFVAQMYFTDEYIYFSYGSIAGTGLFFQGGKIVRVKYDGTGYEVLAGQEELVDAQFSINADGTVNATTGVGSDIYFSGMETCTAHDGNIYCYDERGFERLKASYGDYTQVGSGQVGVYDENVDTAIFLDFAEVADDKLYYLMHFAEPNTDDWISWRESYVRGKSVMFCKDLKSGFVQVLYEVGKSE